MARTSSKVSEQDFLHIISEATSGLTGKDLLDELCRGFARVLKMQFALIAECIEEGGTHVRTLCFVNGNTVADNIEYDTSGRPCELILKGSEIFIPREVYKQFPESKGIEAATGVPIHSSVTGKIIGHIIVSNPHPVTDESNQTAILKIFASRIGAEIERMKAEKELQRQMKENEFYAFTMNHLREAVFWIDQEGNIWQANKSAEELSGYSVDELKKMHVFDVNQTVQQSNWTSVWNNLREKKKVNLDAKFKRKDGTVIDIEITQNFMVFEGREYTCSIVRDTRQRKMEEELLRTVSEATSGLTGEDFLIELARHITMTLTMRYALITECANDEKTRLRTLCYVDGEKVLDNIEYDTADIPCEIIMQGKDFFMPAGVQAKYPKEKDIEAAVGVPIYSTRTGEIIGHILAVDPNPVTTEKNQAAILKIFAARAGAEIERMKAEEKLRLANIELESLLEESNQRYRDLFEEAPIAYVHEGLDSKFIKANKAALRILGVRPDEVSHTYGKTLAPDTPDAQQRLKEAFDSIGRGTDTSGVVLELRRKDNGQPIWIQWWSNPDPGGQFTRTMFVDITDKVMMEKEQARLKAQNQYLQEEIKLNYNFAEIVSKSGNFKKVLQQIQQVASTDATVLILGESGTGKELIARAVHNISNRSKRPLIKVNCATLPANLIESELFGHEKGAFTGAMDRKIGRFELADGGSIFLDEIGELPVELQAKLLRVLQEGEFERLGNPRTMKVNVRVIAATNRDLQQAIEKKEFREDLYYRLNVFPIICPPLRERKEDIPLLVKHFCQKHEGKIGRKITDVSDTVMNALMAYNWPGNIRELENIIERAMILSTGSSLEYGDWIPTEKIVHSGNGNDPKAVKLEDVEREHIIEVLKKTGWKVSGEKGAAKILGLNPTTLEARMKKMGIKRES
ncbi:MAG: sigma 54-interacting transcriptional regulator [Chitinophagaceae bacterium]|nr:sigma 54-interacting transcriptional regulator [Chitinophagaceae bacterium]